MFEVNHNPSPGELRKFGAAMLMGFGAIGVVLWLLAWRKGLMPDVLTWNGAGLQVMAVGLWTLGGGLFVLARFAPGPARPVYVVWMTGGSAMGIVSSTVLLTVLFIVLLPWFSLIVRTGDPLRRRLKRDGTYWEDCKSYDATLERMRRLF